MAIRFLKFVIAILFVATSTLLVARAQKRSEQAPSGQNAQSKSGAADWIDPVQIDEVVEWEVGSFIERGNRLMRAGRLDEALVEYQAAMDKAGKPLVTVYMNIGSVHLLKREYDAAADHYRKAIDMHPKNSMIHFALAEALLGLSRYSEAEAEYRKTIELSADKKNPRARHSLGLSLYAQGRIPAAIAEYRNAIEQMSGDFAQARYDLGLALLAIDQYQDAEREIRLAIEQQKAAWPEAHFNLAVALERQRRFREAAEEYEVYLRQFPEAEDAAKVRERIERLKGRK